MEDKIIRVETKANIDQQALDRLLMLVPARQREDKRLIRFLAFRLKIDGFDNASAFSSLPVFEKISLLTHRRWFLN